MATKKSRRKSPLAMLLALGTLVLLLLLLGYYFENCLKKQLSLAGSENVLGVSTFSSSPSKNPVVNGETFNFAATVVGDQAGVLNATVLFSLTGQGVINSNIGGPGACVKVTDTTAACNNVNIDPNETITWTVPVTASGSCAPSTLTLQTRLVATVVTSTSTATANCVASQPSATTSTGGGTTATNPPAGTNTNTTNTKTTGGTGTSATGAKATPAALVSFDIAGFACSKVSGLPLVLLLLILWLLASAYYFIWNKRK